MVQRIHFWTLWSLCAALALWLVLTCLPLPASLAIGLTMLIIVISLVVALYRTRRQAQLKKTLADIQPRIMEQLAALPEHWRQHLPLVLIIGDLSNLNTVVRGNEQMIQVGVDTPARLPLLATELTNWQQGRPPAAVIWQMKTGSPADTTTHEAHLSAWRVAIAQTQRLLGLTLPVYLVFSTVLQKISASETLLSPNPWYGLTVQGNPLTQHSALQDPLTHWQTALERGASVRGQDLATRAEAASLIEWLRQDVLPLLLGKNHLASPVPLQGIGIRSNAAADAADSPWGRFRFAKTGLQAASINGSMTDIFDDMPASWLHGIRAQRCLAPFWHLLLHSWLIILFALCTAFAASAWNNRQLLERLHSDAVHYRSLSVEQDAARKAALKTLSADIEELKSYADSGIPARLGFGFYSAQGWQPELEKLIADYRPPEAPPTTITLDSLSLFDSGQSTLKAGANRSLIKALTIIQAHPDKRILIAGHTDDIGNAATNLKLSAARAASVRDWLMEAADLPVTRFAIQGYGATHPVVDNTSDQGRARNRRVEITLLPDEAAH